VRFNQLFNALFHPKKFALLRLCKDCVHCCYDRSGGDEFATCLKWGRYDYSTGKTITPTKYCSVERQSTGACFPLGIFWEPAVTIKLQRETKTESLPHCDECEYLSIDDPLCSFSCDLAPKEKLVVSDFTEGSTRPDWCPLLEDTKDKEGEI